MTPAVWNTMFARPAAMSFLSVDITFLPKFAAVTSGESPPTSPLHMSPMVRSTLAALPAEIILFISLLRRTPVISSESPERAPPPTPLPPRWIYVSPSALTKAVPVPMLTTSALLCPLRYCPPLPKHSNSLKRVTGAPRKLSATSDAPTPVSAAPTISFSESPSSLMSFFASLSSLSADSPEGYDVLPRTSSVPLFTEAAISFTAEPPMSIPR